MAFYTGSVPFVFVRLEIVVALSFPRFSLRYRIFRGFYTGLFAPSDGIDFPTEVYTVEHIAAQGFHSSSIESIDFPVLVFRLLLV